MGNTQKAAEESELIVAAESFPTRLQQIILLIKSLLDSLKRCKVFSASLANGKTIPAVEFVNSFVLSLK